MCSLRKKESTAGIVTCNIISRFTVPLLERRARMRTRTSAGGIEHSFKDGDSSHVEFVCFGYKRDKDGALCPDEPNVSIMPQMLRCGFRTPAWVRYQTGCINRTFLTHGEKSVGGDKPSRNCSKMKHRKCDTPENLGAGFI